MFSKDRGPSYWRCEFKPSFSRKVFKAKISSIVPIFWSENWRIESCFLHDTIEHTRGSPSNMVMIPILLCISERYKESQLGTQGKCDYFKRMFLSISWNKYNYKCNSFIIKFCNKLNNFHSNMLRVQWWYFLVKSDQRKRNCCGTT